MDAQVIEEVAHSVAQPRDQGQRSRGRSGSGRQRRARMAALRARPVRPALADWTPRAGLSASVLPAAPLLRPTPPSALAAAVLVDPDNLGRGGNLGSGVHSRQLEPHAGEGKPIITRDVALGQIGSLRRAPAQFSPAGAASP